MNNFADNIRNALNNIEKEVPFLDNVLNIKANTNIIKTDGNIFYPEVILKLYNPDGVGIALNAGGNRAFNSGIGFLLALLDIEIESKNALTAAKAVATSSGGSWLTGSYFFAKQTNNLTNDDLLGRPIPLQDINIENLETYNFDKKTFLGYRCIEYIRLIPSYPYGVPNTLNNIWINIISSSYLKPYGLQSKIVSINEKYAKEIKKNNPDINEQDIIVPPPDYPFWICDSSLLYDPIVKEGSTVFPMTTLYSGFPQILSNGSNSIGGNFIYTYAYGCKYPENNNFTNKNSIPTFGDLQNPDLQTNVSIPKYQGYLTLDYMIGMSSAAYGYNTYKISETNLPILRQADIVNPLVNMWCDKDPNNTKVVQAVDGYISGNATGIVSLVARKQKKIISFITPGTYTAVSIEDFDKQLRIGSEISSLYGAAEATNSLSYTSNPNSIQIFEKSKFEDFVQQALARKKSGGVVYVRQKLRVLPNYRNGVDGNYEVDILYIVSQPTDNFNNLLPPEISNQFMDPNSPFYQFPNYPIDTSYTKGQINLLLSFCYAIVMNTELKDIIKSMYLEE